MTKPTTPPTDADARQAALDRAEVWGVDLSLLRETLRLTPTERLDRHQRALDLVKAFREAVPLPDGPPDDPVPDPEARRG